MSICQNLNSTQEMSFIAGTTQRMEFEILDSNGLPVNLSSSTVQVKFSPYGDSNYTVITKTGIIANDNQFVIILESLDTINLSGLYTFQPIITDVQGKPFKPLQGTVYIQSAIK